MALTQASKERSGQRVIIGGWTAYEMADHREACGLVGLIGEVADRCCVTPEIDVRRNIVFLTVKTESGMTVEDFEFAKTVDFEIGSAHKARALLGEPDDTVWESGETENDEEQEGGNDNG